MLLKQPQINLKFKFWGKTQRNSIKIFSSGTEGAGGGGEASETERGQSRDGAGGERQSTVTLNK
eukprot:9246510-Pyramimonas_sp.AAC.1